MALWVAIIFVTMIGKALIKGHPVAEGVWVALVLIGIYAVLAVGVFLWVRYGDSEGDGEFSEPEHGVKRWRQP